MWVTPAKKPRSNVVRKVHDRRVNRPKQSGGRRSSVPGEDS